MVIAMDGPAGAGKSSVAQAVAAALDFTYLDTGAMYRCVAAAALMRHPHGEVDAETAAAAAQESEIELGRRVRLDNVDVTDLIRSARISGAASEVAAIPAVRAALVEQQRRLLGSGGDWVAEGRDIGTVVWPEAELKLFITATPEERARRRAAQSGIAFEKVLRDQRERDERDMGRVDSPLRPAADAVEIDTTGLSQQQVVDHIVALARAQPGAAGR